MSLLSANELQRLYETNPRDHKVIVNWMLAIIRGRSYSSLPGTALYSAPPAQAPLDPLMRHAGAMPGNYPQRPIVPGQGGSNVDICLRAFLGALPQLVRDQQPLMMATVLQQLPNGAVAPAYALFETGSRLEREGHSLQAMQMYEYVIKHPESTPAELEASMFRCGVLCEGQIANFQRAAHCYREIIRVFPMGPFAESAKTRLSKLEQSKRI